MSLHPAPSWQQLKSQKKSWTGVWMLLIRRSKRLAQNFNMVAADLFQEEMEKFQSATAAGGDVDVRNDAVKSAFTVTHDMRGLSKTFGYPLLGEISSSCAGLY